jgi:hypothetical protein
MVRRGSTVRHTVLDEPHFRAGLFVPNYNDGDSRLLNVAPP